MTDIKLTVEELPDPNFKPGEVDPVFGVCIDGWPVFYWQTIDYDFSDPVAATAAAENETVREFTTALHTALYLSGELGMR